MAAGSAVRYANHREDQATEGFDISDEVVRMDLANAHKLRLLSRHTL